jgi:preprotein translocase subunit SecG
MMMMMVVVVVVVVVMMIIIMLYPKSMKTCETYNTTKAFHHFRGFPNFLL